MGAGDFLKDDFSDEERAALGEVEGDKGTVESPEKTDLEANEAVKTDAEVKAEKTDPAVIVKTEDGDSVELITENGRQYILDKDGEKIPVERFKKVIYKEKTALQEKEQINNKLNLFKQLGAEEYYKVYPGEKPSDFKPKETEPTTTEEDFNSMVVNGGKYHGQTIGDVAQVDPVAASLMVNNYLEGKRATVEAETRKHTEFQNSFIAEKNSFCLSRAKEMFGKENDFTPEEIDQVNGEYKKLSDFMIAQKIAHYRMEDAYLLMNKDKIIKSAQIKSAKAAIDEATKKAPGSIGNGDSNAGLTGFEAVLSMSEDALMKHIDKMSDRDQTKFYKDAPKAMREKYPSLPW
jgi:hypothetical protein